PGSHLDRHQWIGEGAIGPEPFRRIMREPRFAGVIKIIETPKGDDPVLHDRRMLRRLRAYARGPRDTIRMTATVGGAGARSHQRHSAIVAPCRSRRRCGRVRGSPGAWYRWSPRRAR